MDSDDETFDFQNTPLVEAAKNGELDNCQMLLLQWEQHLSPSHITSRHLAPALAAAIGSKHPQVVAYVLEQGAIISGIDMVLALGDTDASITMFQTFLDHGWDINSKTDLGNTMLKCSPCSK